MSLGGYFLGRVVLPHRNFSTCCGCASPVDPNRVSRAPITGHDDVSGYITCRIGFIVYLQK
jgi:hypothetical protein